MMESAGRDIIVIGSSAGGVEALTELLPLLSRDLAASVFIVQHRSTHEGRPDYLPGILQRRTSWPVMVAANGQRTARGCVYVAPPHVDMLLTEGHIWLEPRLPGNPARDGIDRLFRSAALTYGRRVAAVLLTGVLEDGIAGFWDVQRHEGVTIVQHPTQAKFRSLPLGAMSEVPVHYCLSIPDIASTLSQLALEPSAPLAPARRTRVLIVEDERIVATNLVNKLADLGYDIVGSVARGEDALHMIAVDSPDIVLMDVELEGEMSGTDAARIAWEQRKIPIVFVTAYSDQQTLADARASRPYGFIVKPYRFAQIHAVLQLAIDRHEQETQNRRKWTTCHSPPVS